MTSTVFNEQAFLLYNIRKLAQAHNQIHSTQKYYTKLDLFKGDPTDTINLILNNHFRKRFPILSMSDDQRSALTPRISLFKQVLAENGTEIIDEFPIEFPIRFNDVLNQGGEFFGISKFFIEAQGRTSYTPDKSYTGSLELNFSSLDPLLRVRSSKSLRTGKYYTFSFLDLFMQSKVAEGTTSPPNITESPPPINPTQQQLSQNVFNTFIRVEMGWNVNPENPLFAKSSLTSEQRQKLSPEAALLRENVTRNEDILLAVQETVLSFILHPTTNRINIGYGGFIGIIINYTGANDLILRKNQSSPFVSPKYLEEYNKRLKAIFSDSNNNPLFDRSVDQELIALQNNFNLDAYNSVNTKIRQSSKLCMVSLSQGAVEQFSTYVGANPESDGVPENSSRLNRDGQPIIEPIDFSSLPWNYNTVTGEDGSQYTVFSPISSPSEVPPTFLQTITDLFSTDNFGAEATEIQFFYLGDLLEILMSNSFDKPDNDPAIANLVPSYGSRFKDRIKLILTDIEIYDPASPPERIEKIRLNLAHVPVSFKAFNKFFFENVTSRNDPHEISIDDLIRDILQKLIKDVFLSSPIANIGSMRQRNFDIKFTSFNRYFVGGVGDFFTPVGDVNVLVPFGDTPIERVLDINENDRSISDPSGSGAINSADKFDPKNLHYFMMIYQSSVSDKLRGDVSEDYLRCIPHLNIATNQGIIKRVMLNQTENTALRDHRIINNPGTTTNALTNLYNADLMLHATDLFPVGSFVYINPSALGDLIGNPSDVNSYANFMGLGGYYSILSTRYQIDAEGFTVYCTTTNYYTGARGANQNGTATPVIEAVGITDPPPLPVAPVEPPPPEQQI